MALWLCRPAWGEAQFGGEKLGDFVALVFKQDLSYDGDVGFLADQLNFHRSKPEPVGPTVGVKTPHVGILLWYLEPIRPFNLPSFVL